MLLFDDIYIYPGYHHTAALCRVRVYEVSGPELVIVFSELTGELEYLGENKGTSITNRAGVLATEWRQRYHPEVDITFVEHYPARGYAYQRDGTTIWQHGETFDLVIPAWDTHRRVARTVAWMPLGRAKLEAQIGEPWPESEGINERTYLHQRG